MNRSNRKAHKQKERRDRIRREKHQSKLERAVDPGPFSDESEDASLARALPHFATERFNWELNESMGGRILEDAGEIPQFFTDADLEAARASKNPKFRAQMLAFDAMEADSPLEAVALAREALKIDPNCVDALATVANDPRNTIGQRIAGLRLALAAAEAELGPDFAEKYKGEFWIDHVTRPYMRTRFDLAMELQQGNEREALAHLEGLLELEPDDSLGVRDILIGTYLLTGNRKGQKRLLDQFDDGFFAMFNWSRVLYEFVGGDLERAREALDRARAHNPHVEPYLLGKPAPQHVPELYSIGEPSEAQQVAFFTAVAWRETPGAVAWLRAQTVGNAAAKGTR